MIYTAPAKGEDGLYFVKVLNDDKRKCFVQLNKVRVENVSEDIVIDLVSDVNIQKIDTIDTLNLEAAHENCAEWFGKTLSENVFKGAYTLSVGSGQITGDRLENTKVFNTRQESIDFDNIQTNKTCDVILEFAGLWFAKKAFGSSWNVVQVRVHDDPIIDTYPDEYAFVDEVEE